MNSGRRPDPTKQQQELRTTTAERLEAIVEAAQRAAEGVIDDAETQARRYLAEARAEADRVTEVRVTELSALIDVLVGRAAGLRGEAEQLQTTLEEARFRIDPGRPVAPSGEPLQPVEPAP